MKKILLSSMSYILLVFIYLFILLSYLTTMHIILWPSFESNIFALCGLYAFVFLAIVLVHRFILSFNFFVLLVFSFVPLIQYQFGLVRYLGDAVVVWFFLFNFSLAYLCSYNLGLQDVYRKKLLLHFSIIMVIASIISSVFAILQWTGFSVNMSFVYPLIGRRPYANLAQPNHLATLLYMGLICLWYLYENCKINKIIIGLIGQLIIFGIVLTQSRTAWILTIIIPIVYFFYKNKFHFKTKDYEVLIICVLFVFYYMCFPWLSVFFHLVRLDSVIQRGGEGYLRFVIWQQMYDALKLNPWIGYGWNQVSFAQMSVVENFKGPVERVSNAHNILVNLVVYNGVLLGGSVVVYILFWVKKIIISIKNNFDFYVFLLLIPLAVHSFLEYPLDYGYFLFPCAFLLGLISSYFDRKILIINYSFVFMASAIGIIVGMFCAKEYIDIRSNFFQAYLHYDEAKRSKDKPAYNKKIESFMPHTKILTQVAVLEKMAAYVPHQHMTEDEILWMKDVVNRYPSRFNLSKYLLALELNHKTLEYKVYKAKAHSLYPEMFSD